MKVLSDYFTYYNWGLSLIVIGTAMIAYSIICPIFNIVNKYGFALSLVFGIVLFITGIYLYKKRLPGENK